MHPVLCSLAHEVLLFASCRGVALDGVAARADGVVELGQIHDIGIVVVLVEGLLLEAGREDGFQGEAGDFLCAVSGRRG